MTETTEYLYEFADFRLLPSERLLLRNEEPVQLAPKVFDTLLVLVENGGHLIEKDELLNKVWAEVFVEEGTLARNVSILRKVLGESDEQKFIETIPKRGYRFVETVRQQTVEEKSAPLSAEEKPIPEIKKAVSTPPRRPILWLMFGFVVIAGTFASLSFWSAKTNNPDVVKSIAVLPFKTIDTAERDESLELGMAEAVITRLGKVRQIVVRPAGTISKYLENPAEAAQAGRDLQTEAVLDGTIQRQADTVRVTARLIRTADGAQLWAETFDAKFTDIFAVQDSISAQIAQSLNLKLSGGEKNSLSKHETNNPEAYQTYLKGQYFIEKRHFAKAIDYFTQSIVLDPNLAAAYTGLADAYALQVSFTVKSPQENLPKARTAVEKALSFDENSADAHTTLGHILWLEWNWQGAEKSLRRALELNPNSSLTHTRYSVYLSSIGRHDEAIAEARRALELDPTSISVNQTLERAFYFARRYDEALAASEKTLKLNPNAYHPNSWRELTLGQKGMSDAAVEFRFKTMATVGVEPQVIENLREFYRAKGWQNFWRRQAAELEAKVEKKYVSNYTLARYYTRAGEKEKALSLLEKCADEHSDHLTLLKVDPIFDNLHSNPRFVALLKRIGLE